MNGSGDTLCRSRNVFWLFLLLAGCAVSPPLRTTPPLPAPSNFKINGSVDLELPPKLSAQSGLPGTIKATLDAAATAEAISTTPLRSHHEGHLSLVITDDSGKQTFANIHISISGETAGPPDEGLARALSRFLDSAMLMSRPAHELPNAKVK